MSTASKRPAARKLLNKVTANAAESDCIVIAPTAGYRPAGALVDMGQWQLAIGLHF